MGRFLPLIPDSYYLRHGFAAGLSYREVRDLLADPEWREQLALVYWAIEHVLGFYDGPESCPIRTYFRHTYEPPC